ncbi:NACHT, LRR and PYD domains-containing protein 6 [Vipera latastei]
MNSTVREELYKGLNDLFENQFEEFKWQLMYIDHSGKPNIFKASLEKANKQEVVDLLIQNYGEDAPKVCIHVLQKSNINDVANKLEETLQQVTDADAPQLSDSSGYKDHIKQNFQTIEDPNAVPGDYVLLNERYSELIILDYYRPVREREHEILATGRKHFEIISKRAESSTSVEKLFNPNKYGLIPQTVVLQGAAGIGKTTTAKKIMLDWASQQLYHDKFNYVFYIYCREINLHAESEKSSIAEIISKQWPRCHGVKNVIRNILKNEEKLLFIIDGFDELRYSFDQPEDSFCFDPWKEEPVKIILRSLFRKKLLPESSLIITTRPIALEKLHRCLQRPHYFQILGFSREKREKYFYKFFENENQATQALRFVKQNDTLFTMCTIPLVCWIICTVVKQEMETGKDLQKTPCTLTAIYMWYLSSLLDFHHKESKQDVQRKLKTFCSLAAEGIWKHQILFMEEEVKKHSLDQDDLFPLFLNQNIFRKDIHCVQTFSFVHLSFQEFFAALFYILEGGEEQHSKNLQILLNSHDIYFRSTFAVGFHFLFGFLNEENRMKELKKEFGWEISSQKKKVLLDWLKEKINKRIYMIEPGLITGIDLDWVMHHYTKSYIFKFFHKKTFSYMETEILSYLYETQDENFVKDALCAVTTMEYHCNSDTELMILAYCLQYCQNLENLSVRSPTSIYPTEKKMFLVENRQWGVHEEYLEDFFKALTKLRNLRILRLEKWSFTQSCSRQLVEVFKTNQKLKELDLFLTNETAIQLLCEGLQHPDCKIEILELYEEFMTELYSSHVAEMLRKNQRIKELLMFLIHPEDQAFQILCEGLQHPDCKVERLWVVGHTMTEFCSGHLAEVFRKSQRLNELWLWLYKADDRVVEMLCEGLQHPDCKVEKLG